MLSKYAFEVVVVCLLERGWCIEFQKTGMMLL